jgi:hypothetical protein
MNKQRRHKWRVNRSSQFFESFLPASNRCNLSMLMYIELLSLQCRQEVLTQYQDQGLTVADDTHVGQGAKENQGNE